MEGENVSSANYDPEEALARRRALLTRLFNALPLYASPAFWQVLEARETPLEVVARCLRLSVSLKDDPGRERLLEIVFARTYGMNQKWAQAALKNLPILTGERSSVVNDLCADLYECVFKALLDPTRLFWEENFLHCLYFERKHVYQAFLFREGYWKNTRIKQGTRVPRSLLERFDSPGSLTHEGYAMFDIVDEDAQRSLETLVNDEMLHLVLTLPERLKAVILLKFWGDCTEKEAAQILGVTDRTVRHRILVATELLRKYLTEEKVGG
ncbi:MAG TPA: sigma factor-like helix-turn-helix DNA-binding protein [Ktedonobacteraceae bacterium]|nr:sigma factor-like helix-turn-helix DNA-binding protein [Ktedonobacteraceae bacterium]